MVMYDDKIYEFKVVQTDYETFIVKCTHEGIYLLMSTPKPDESMVQSFCCMNGITGVRIC